MQVKVINLEGKEVSQLQLDAEIFGAPMRSDILSRVVHWQLAKRRAGTHKTKGVSEISGTTKKPFNQKGTGRARQGSLRSPQFRGGATIFGPVVRDHGYSLPKKVRRLGMKVALSAKLQEGKLIIVDSFAAKDLDKNGKTQAALKKFEKLGLTSALFIDADAVEANFAQAISNIPYMDALPQIGANVYDILKREHLVLTADAVKKIEERLK